MKKLRYASISYTKIVLWMHFMFISFIFCGQNSYATVLCSLCCIAFWCSSIKLFFAVDAIQKMENFSTTTTTTTQKISQISLNYRLNWLVLLLLLLLLLQEGVHWVYVNVLNMYSYFFHEWGSNFIAEGIKFNFNFETCL